MDGLYIYYMRSYKDYVGLYREYIGSQYYRVIQELYTGVFRASAWSLRGSCDGMCELLIGTALGLNWLCLPVSHGLRFKVQH